MNSNQCPNCKRHFLKEISNLKTKNYSLLLLSCEICGNMYSLNNHEELTKVSDNGQ